MQTVAIVGQGYVGLPLAQGAAGAGLKVIGYDISNRAVDGLNAGRSHVDDLSDADIATMLSQGYRASADPRDIALADVVVICVPTPLAEAGGPDLSAVEAATRSVGENLNPDGKTTIVLESTTYPGTTDDVVKPIIESFGHVYGVDFLLAFSPERVDPGRTDYTIKTTPKVIGGVTKDAAQAAAEFYDMFIDTTIIVKGTKEAETAKLLENTFRHVNIALVNEMAQFCHELGIDIWEVIRGAESKPFGFMKFTPGPGVGGHCIPIDPNYLSYEVRKELGYPFHFVELAQEINSGMPQYVRERVAELLNEKEKSLRGSKVLLLGVTYKPNIADQRESPSVPVAQQLLKYGAVVSYHDPRVAEWNIDDITMTSVGDLNAAVAEADVVVLLQNHSEYDVEALAASAELFFDTRGATKSDNATRL